MAGRVILIADAPTLSAVHWSLCPPDSWSHRTPKQQRCACCWAPVSSVVRRQTTSSSAHLESAPEVPRRPRARCFVAGRASCPSRTQRRDDWIRPSSATSSISAATSPRRFHCRVFTGGSRRGGEPRLLFCSREDQSLASAQLHHCYARSARVRMASLDGEAENARPEVASSVSDSEDSTPAPSVSGSAWQRCGVGKGCDAAQQTIAADAPPAARPLNRSGALP